MAQETMTPEERVLCALALEKPDRVPIHPILDAAPAATLTGRDHIAAYKTPDAQLDTVLACFDQYGGWDLVTPAPVSVHAYQATGFRVAYPQEGNDVTQIQLLEEEIVTRDDLNLIADIGWNRFVYEHMVWRSNDMTPEKLMAYIAENNALYARAREEWTRRHALIICPLVTIHPFFALSVTRTMLKFTEDIFYHPQLVKRALDKMVPEWIETFMAITKAGNSKSFIFSEERAGAYFMPLSVFEELWWPYTEQIVDAFWSEGITCTFHLDTCWDKNLPYFKRLPKKSCVIDLDGTTDIFAAAELLRGHCGISTDVHPALLSLGKPEDVEAYVKKLIDEIGVHGGMILSTGCETPVAVKPENFRAMIETGKTYELSKK